MIALSAALGGFIGTLLARIAYDAWARRRRRLAALDANAANRSAMEARLLAVAARKLSPAESTAWFEERYADDLDATVRGEAP